VIFNDARSDPERHLRLLRQSHNTIRRILREPEREADATAPDNAQTLAPIEDAFRHLATMPCAPDSCRPGQQSIGGSSSKFPIITGGKHRLMPCTSCSRISPACILAGCDQVILDEYCEGYMQREGDEPGSAPEISAFCALDDDEEPSI
jgi:hypothetical protein